MWNSILNTQNLLTPSKNQNPNQSGGSNYCAYSEHRTQFLLSALM